jgi:hypothetical protein
MAEDRPENILWSVAMIGPEDPRDPHNPNSWGLIPIISAGTIWDALSQAEELIGVKGRRVYSISVLPFGEEGESGVFRARPRQEQSF